MSDDRKKSGLPEGMDDDFDWDEVLKEWADELDKIAPSDPPPPEPKAKRPLYRPPSQPPAKAAPKPRPKPQEPVIPPPADDRAGFDDLDGLDAVTRISEVSAEVYLASEAAAADPTAPTHTRPTSRPPPEDVELNLDDLLDQEATPPRPQQAPYRPPRPGGPPPAPKAGAESEPPDPFGGLIPIDDEDEARTTVSEPPTAPPRAGIPGKRERHSTQPLDVRVSTKPPALMPAPAAPDAASPPPAERPTPRSTLDELDDLLGDVDDQPTRVAAIDAMAEPSHDVSVPGPAPESTTPPRAKRPAVRPPSAGEPRRGLADLKPRGATDADPPGSAAQADATLDDLAPHPKQAADASGRDASDAGAQAARRTVRYRKPRQETFPLVGRAPEALWARRDLMVRLAAGAKGSPRAKLLVAAGELADQLAQPAEAQVLYAEAHEADPQDVVALRALRRGAILEEDWRKVASLLEAEAALPLSMEDRGASLMFLAEVQLHRLSDLDAAERSARSAAGLKRGSLEATALLAEVLFALKKDAEAHTLLERAAGSWKDPAGRATLLAEAAEFAERHGQLEPAQRRYAAAAEADPSRVDALLGAARCAKSRGEIDAARDVIVLATTFLGDGPVGEAFRHQAARLVHVAGKRPAEALPLLGDARSPVSSRARADAARATGDRQAETEAVEAWATASGGTRRALALLRLAELHVDGGLLEEADEALRDAARADSGLTTVRVVREVLARRAGDRSRLATAVDMGGAGGALAAAARSVKESTALERERELLAAAAKEGDALACVDVVALDAAAAAGDTRTIEESLTREVERSAPEQMLGPLLLLSDLELAAGHLDGAEAHLAQARDVAEGAPMVLRPLARLTGKRDAEASAALWLEESLAASGQRAAFAATWAGRILAAGGLDAAEAYRRALGAHADYAPAVWALEPLARRAGDTAALAELNERQAGLTDDSVESAGRWMRAGLVRAAEDEAAAIALLDRARKAVPGDFILSELVLRMGHGLPATEQAAILEASSENAPEDLARAARLRAAAALEAAGEHARAAALYRRILGDISESDPIARHAIDRAESAAGENARIAERRFAAVRGATDEGSKVQALQRLADLDLHERHDSSSAILSLQSILEVAPGHLPSLRTLERQFMDQDRGDELSAIELALADNLSATGTGDGAAHLRLAARLLLAQEGAGGDAADPILLPAADRDSMDPWVARRALGAAQAHGETEKLVRASLEVLGFARDPLSRTSAGLVASHALEACGRGAEAATLLGPLVEATPDHPTAAERLGQLLVVAGEHVKAAEAFETAARASHVARRTADCWYDAGVIWQEKAGDLDRAVEALMQAAAVDATHLDVFPRLRTLLTERGEGQRLAELTERRLAAGGDAAVLVELHTTLAGLRQDLGDGPGAIQALRAALALEPDQADTLERLANLCLEERDFRGAAEALIRIARLRKDRDVLRWVFFSLGDIYDAHIPDPKRSEAAYQRVLKLIPTDTEAMARLADMYSREGNARAAAEMLQQLATHELDPDKNRDYQLRLAQNLEQAGDVRKAESVLDRTRRNIPTDLTVLRAMADFYGRQNAQSALSMHLNRAVADLRAAIQRDATELVGWSGLVELLGWRGRPDAARAAASAAAAVGMVDPDLAHLLDAQGGIPGAGPAASDPEIEETLSPPMLNRVTRAVFQLAGDAFEKVLPFDPRSLAAERLPKEHGFRQATQQIARWFQIPDLQLYYTRQAPRVCVAVSSHPPTIVLGSELFTVSNEREKEFLLARAVKAAKTNLAVVVRSQPAQLATAIAGLVRSYDSNYSPHGMDAAVLDDAARRMTKAVHRRIRDELMPLVIEMAGAHDFDPTRLGLAASELGDRVALLAVGSTPSAIDGLFRLAGNQIPASAAARLRVQAVGEIPEAASLLAFSISDDYFDARQRAGADRQ